MNYADMHMRLVTQKALMQRTNHYDLHEPFLRKPRRSYVRPLLNWFGVQLEQAGKSLQERYSSAPRLAQ